VKHFDPTVAMLDTESQIRQRLENARAKLHGDRCLWSERYSDVQNWECAHRFVIECCWTWNEANQRVRLIPDKRYIREVVKEWHRAYISRTPLLLYKSRRMILSWVFRALELWVCGLGRADWMIVDQDYGNASKHTWRYWHYYQELRKRRPEMRLPAAMKYGSVEKKQLDQVILPNGSVMSNSNMEAGKLQGTGMAGITLEELSRYRYPDGVWSQANLMVQGEADEESSGGGWVNGICNASPSIEFRRIKRFWLYDAKQDTFQQFVPNDEKDFVRSDAWPVKIMNGFHKVEDSGVIVGALHYSADESKNEKWESEEKAKMTPRAWRVEMDMEELEIEGKPVHESFVPEKHAPMFLRKSPLKFDPSSPFVIGSTFFVGLDAGSASLNPAAVVSMVTPMKQVLTVGEFMMSGTSLEQFYPAFVTWWQEHFPWLLISNTYCACDETARQKNGVTGTTGEEVANRHGIQLMLIPNTGNARVGAVDRLLMEMIDERTPKYAVCAFMCPMVYAALSGSYRRTESIKGSGIFDLPVKDQYSHPMDALQYVSILILQWLESNGFAVAKKSMGDESKRKSRHNKS
jgi:hypothetical protein